VANIPASRPGHRCLSKAGKGMIKKHWSVGLELGHSDPGQPRRGCRVFATVTSLVRLLPDPCITIDNLPAIYPNNHHFNCANIFLRLAKSRLRNFVPYIQILIIVYSQVVTLFYPRFISIDYFASTTSAPRARNKTWDGLANARSGTSRACNRYRVTEDSF
jgi:hypothetical protein